MQETRDKPILIAGGGMAGITAAVEAAEAGVSVVLVESLPYLGGNAIAMNRYFPKMCPPYCGMEINFRRIKDNPLIQSYVSTKLTAIEQMDTGFRVSIESSPEYVNDNCTLCGDCSVVCPLEQADAFNQLMSKKKAIDHPHDLAYPEKYHLDDSFCLKEECSKCMEACTYDAIDLIAESQTLTLEVQSIILATGWQSFDPITMSEYSFGNHPDILTSLMMERMSAPNGPTAGKIRCHASDCPPKEIAFVQCVGSRDEKHLPYCSGVCCSASLKQALHAVEVLPDVEVSIHYIDLRVTGRNEDFLRKAENHPRIKLIKGKVTKVNSDDRTSLKLTAEHIDSGKKITSSANLVVLATGIIPNKNPVADLLPENRSFMNSTSLPKGIYLAGAAQQPMDVSATVKSATAAVLLGISESQIPNNE